MEWHEVEEILSSGNADITLKCGDVKVRPTHQAGRAFIRVFHRELSLFEPIRTSSYKPTNEIIDDMKRFEPDSNRWIRL